MVEDEVWDEVEAVQAVYGDDCQVIQAYPPNLRVHLKPRTADVSAQQFVEATIGIMAGPQYPEEPPDIWVIDSKGFDDQRQKLIIASIRDKSFELTPGLMLVALCEEAVERLSSMNHPDGDCPLCLYPLLDQDAGGDAQTFMKLMSCFHCFHCDCIIEWWNWMQMQTAAGIKSSSTRNVEDQQGIDRMMEGSMANCPVCRKVFLSKDIEHVVDLVGIRSYCHRDANAIANYEDILQSDFEKIRRQKYESILKLQQENGGLIEPKVNEVLLPGMFLTPSPALYSTESSSISNEPQNNSSADNSDAHPGTSLSRRGSLKPSNSKMRRHRQEKNGSLIEPKANEGVLLPGMYLSPSPALHSRESSSVSDEPQNAGSAGNSDTHPGSSLSRGGSMQHSNSNMRKYRQKNSRKQGSVWIRKDNDPGQ